MPRERIGLDSRLAVARLGLATASRFCLLAKYRSGVRLSRASQAVGWLRDKKITLTGYSFFVPRERIELSCLSARDFESRASAYSATAAFLYYFSRQAPFCQFDF